MPQPDADAELTELSRVPAFADARRTARPLRRIATLGGMTALIIFGLLIWMRPHRDAFGVFGVPLRGGTGTLLLAALLVSLTGLCACLLVLHGRARALDLNAIARPSPVSRLAGWPQGLLILCGAALSVAALVWQRQPSLPLAGQWTVVLGILVGLAFVMLMAERIVGALPIACLPERDALAGLLRLPAAVLLAEAAFLAASRLGLPVGGWSMRLLQAYVGLVAAELALRTLAIWFLPPRAPLAARAMIGSLAAAMLLPSSLRPSRVAARLKAEFGIDITRSWALRYSRAAAAPVLLCLLVFTWCLSGVVRVGLNARGSYERFGAPVAMLGPGLHLLLPWPFGRLRLVEYGVVHAVALEAAGGPTQAMPDRSTADGPAPQSANRLWDQSFVNDTSYIIASTSGSRQSFETASVKVNVLYRVGLTEADERRALYSLVDPVTLIRSVAGQELAHFFVDRTLSEVLGEPNAAIATGLKTAVQRDLDAQKSGLEVLALIVESLHPPGGAAAAYRGVQTAQIVASMQYSREQGRAQTTLSVAQADAQRMRDQAEAAAAERVDSAREEQERSAADILAYRQGGRAFLVERYFQNLRGALAQGSIDIVDSRLGGAGGAIFDLRSAMPAPSQRSAP